MAGEGGLEGLPEVVKTAALLLAALAFIILFQAHPRDTGWIIVASALAVGGTRTGVKCLHAHYANLLAGADDPVGRWTAARLEPDGSPHRAGERV